LGSGAEDQLGQRPNAPIRLKYSAVWYYRELALKVGELRMKKYVNAFNYGNKAVSGRVDNFWLNDVLSISADEQVEFLKTLYSGRLPVSKRSIEIVKEIFVFERGPGYTLSAKTGGGPIREGVYHLAGLSGIWKRAECLFLRDKSRGRQLCGNPRQANRTD
jgi:beta-lactamase class D/beta-lactamase class D OXA-10